jgi:TRAP-type uncharacterized transport system fused permease subunit
MSALYGLIALIIVTLPIKQARFTPRRIMQGFEIAARTSLVVAVICGSVGILISSVFITGATLRLAVLLVDAAGGHLLLLLLLAGLTSLVLGTGVPAIASYILLATAVAPAIVELGVPAIGAHLFVLYWGISHMLTPPVGGALYIASSFSGVDIWRQGYHAMKLGIAVFVVPFIFCYHPELLMIGTPSEIAFRTAIALLTMFSLAAAFAGYLLAPLNWIERLLLVGAGVALIVGNSLAILSGGITLAAVAIRQKLVQE